MDNEYLERLRERFCNDDWEGKSARLFGHFVTIFWSPERGKYAGGWSWVSNGKFSPWKFHSIREARDNFFEYMTGIVQTRIAHRTGKGKQGGKQDPV